jgi:hypothetical protein
LSLEKNERDVHAVGNKNGTNPEMHSNFVKLPGVFNEEVRFSWVVSDRHHTIGLSSKGHCGKVW